MAKNLKPQILFITSFWPYPDNDGGRNVSSRLLKSLLKFGKVEIITYIQENVLSVKEAKLHVIAQNPNIINIHLIKWNRLPTRHMIFKWFTGKSFYFERDFNSFFLEILLKILSKNWDFIIIDKTVPLVFVPYIKNFIKQNKKQTKVIFFSHNVEANLIKDYIKFLPLLKKYSIGQLLKIEYQLAKRQELNLIKNVDLLTCISEYDAKYFRQNGIKNVQTFPPAFFDLLPLKDIKSNYNIKLVSNLSWIPNALGMLKFLKITWPRILKYNKKVTLTLASKKINPKLKSIIEVAKNVKYIGYLPNEQIEAFFDDASLTISPIWMGSGIKIKVLRAFQMGIPLIATKKSIEGLPQEIYNTVPNTNDPYKLADLINQHISNLKELKKLQQKQRAFAKNFLMPSRFDNYIQKILEVK